MIDGALVIFDNYEDVLPGGQAVSRAAQASQVEPGTFDPELPKLVGLLVAGVTCSSRFLFTSRRDFQPLLEPERLPESAVEHWPLEELRFSEAIYLMEALPALASLPVFAENERPVLTKREVYRRVGGHPYTLHLLERHARAGSLEKALEGATGLKEELLVFTLIESAVAQLSVDARALLRRAAVFRQPVPKEGLAYLMGDEKDVMPEVRLEIDELISWGLLSQLPGENRYHLPALARQWVQLEWAKGEEQELLNKAARYWLTLVRESHSPDFALAGWECLFELGEFEAAFAIVSNLTEALQRWGKITLILQLLHRSIDTLEGRPKAIAQQNLGIVYETLGQYNTARQLYQESLSTDEILVDFSGKAHNLYHLGRLAFLQSDYTEARRLYQEALKIAEELDDSHGKAIIIHGLGELAYAQDDYIEAQRLFQVSLITCKESNDLNGVAINLYNLGSIASIKGNYSEMHSDYQEAFKIFEKLGNLQGMGIIFLGLGMFAEKQSDYPKAGRLFRQAQIDTFQSDLSIPFFLISLKAGGLGLNLTAADYVIHIDPWWNPAVETQASDRTHRIGQEKPVFIFKLIARDTVEEKILVFQERKKNLVDQIITTESAFFKSLTKEDVQVLFS